MAVRQLQARVSRLQGSTPSLPAAEQRLQPAGWVMERAPSAEEGGLLFDLDLSGHGHSHNRRHSHDRGSLPYPTVSPRHSHLHDQSVCGADVVAMLTRLARPSNWTDSTVRAEPQEEVAGLRLRSTDAPPAQMASQVLRLKPECVGDDGFEVRALRGPAARCRLGVGCRPQPRSHAGGAADRGPAARGAGRAPGGHGALAQQQKPQDAGAPVPQVRHLAGALTALAHALCVPSRLPAGAASDRVPSAGAAPALAGTPTAQPLTAGTSCVQRDGTTVVIEPRFREQFLIAQPTADYSCLLDLDAIHEVYVGHPQRLRTLVEALCPIVAKTFAAKKQVGQLQRPVSAGD